MMSVFLTTYQGAILGPIARLLGYILQGIYSVLSTVGIEYRYLHDIVYVYRECVDDTDADQAAEIRKDVFGYESGVDGNSGKVQE